MSSRQALAARHLARKVTHTVSRNAGLPSDLLTASSIDTRYCGGTGFPEGDSVAYEPTQGLLAVRGPEKCNFCRPHACLPLC